MNPVRKIAKAIRDNSSYKTAKRATKNVSKTNKSKRVVFICQCESVWLKSEPVYLLLKERGVDCKLLVVDDPAVEKRTESIFDKYRKDVVRYYPGVIDELNPRIVFYSRPYDHYLPKDIRSSAVVKKALLAYIPYYIYQNADDNGLLEKRFADRISFYFADQPESAKQFREICKKGLKSGHLHCLEFGYPFLETISELYKKGDTTNSAFTKNTNGIKVIWTPRWEYGGYYGGSNFLKYKDLIFDYFLNNDKYSFVFRPHPLMFNNFIKKGLITEQEKEELLKRIEESSNAVYDYSGDYIPTLIDADYLISDNSSIVLEFSTFNKPLLYCSPNIQKSLSEFWHQIIDCNFFITNAEKLKGIITILEKKKVDEKAKLRRKLSDNIYHKNHGSTKRIVDYIIEKLK